MWPLTEGALVNAYNVDVTQLDTQDRVVIPEFSSFSGVSDLCYKTESVHFWPVNFYSNTIAGVQTPAYQVFGISLSEESGEAILQAKRMYPPGNGNIYGDILSLGTPDPECSAALEVSTPAYTGTKIPFTPSYSIKSPSGDVNILGNGLEMQTGSPVWIAGAVSNANTLNNLSFDCVFTSGAGARGLLSVVWDTNVIGLIDEFAVPSAGMHCVFSFVTATPGSTHALGFHLDPFTGTQSRITITNIVAGFVGVTAPFSLSATSSAMDDSSILQLNGQVGNYHVQGSQDMQTWTNIAVLANTTGNVQFVDLGRTNFMFRFYRGISP